MKFWQSTAFNDPLELPEIARGAEAAGFEGVLVSDHLFVPAEYEPAYLYSDSGRPDFDTNTPFPDPWVTIATMAACTNQLRFCTMIYILPLYHPLEVAKSVGTLSLFTGGRVILGAGAGWMKEEFESLDVDFGSRGRRFNESIEVLRKVWQGGLVEHKGEFFDIPTMAQTPAPPQPVPIAIGGASQAALSRAGRLGDGWLGAGNTVEDAKGILRKLSELREKAGRAEEPCENIVPLIEEATPEQMAELSGLGAHGSVNYPFVYTCGPDASLQQKLDMMASFGENVIAHMRDV